MNSGKRRFFEITFVTSHFFIFQFTKLTSTVFEWNERVSRSILDSRIVYNFKFDPHKFILLGK